MVACKNGDTRRIFSRLCRSSAWMSPPERSQACIGAARERTAQGRRLAGLDQSESPVPLQSKDIPSGGPRWWVANGSHGQSRPEGLSPQQGAAVAARSRNARWHNAGAGSGWCCRLSAICPHAGCDVDAWADDQKILECSCHYSRYNPRNGAMVVDGPARRCARRAARTLPHRSGSAWHLRCPHSHALVFQLTAFNCRLQVANKENAHADAVCICSVCDAAICPSAGNARGAGPSTTMAPLRGL